MQGERMLIIVNVHRKILEIVNLHRRKGSDWSKQRVRMLGNRKCTQKKYSESSMYAEKILEIIIARRKNAQNRQ